MSTRGRAGRAIRVVVSAAALATLGLGAEAVWVVTRDYLPADSAPPAEADVTHRGEQQRPPLRLVVLGDSTAAGVGATSTQTSVGGRAARIVADATGRPVELRSVAVSGARAADLAGQVQAALDLQPAVALVLIGANDATHLTALDAVASDVREAVERLVAAGAEVVVGTCPDMGAARAFPQPLREIVGWRGRAVASAEVQAVRAAGGRAVDLGRLTGPAFRADPRTLSSDEFHPSDRGYRLWAQALAPALRAAAKAAT